LTYWYGNAIPEYGNAIPDFYLVWQLSHLFPHPCLTLLKIEAYAYGYRPGLLRNLGVSLKYKWQKIKIMMALSTFYFDRLACGHHYKSREIQVAKDNKI